MSTEIAANLAAVRSRIEAAARRVGREPAGIALVAVSKKKPAAVIRAAFAAGQRDFGENYVQEMLAKQDELAAAETEDGGGAAGWLDEVRWHYIGPLQRNKVKHVLGRAVLLHGVDSRRLLDEIEKRSAREDVVTPVLLQVNVAGEASKSGCAPEELPELARHAASLGAVRLEGLMTMPPFSADPEEGRPFFRRLRALRDALVADHGLPEERLSHLSMGMSNDFEVAIEEGATIVRVGSSIFGARE